MQLLSGQEVFSTLERHCRSASGRVVLASAYVKEEAFYSIASQVDAHQCGERILISRWRLDDLVSGASDIEVYRRIRELGWKLYIDQNLHAKTYLIDDTVILGSANLTSSGLNQQSGYPNIETMLVEQADIQVERWIESLLSNSIAVDDDLFDKISHDVKSQPVLKRKASTYSQDVLDIFRKKDALMTFYTKDMPWLRSPSELLVAPNNLECSSDRQHDIELLGCSENANTGQHQKAFQKLLVWRWLKANASEAIYFGELSSRLHDALQDDPKVYRKTAKDLLVNLLNWADQLLEDRVSIDTPNFSQRIKIASD